MLDIIIKNTIIIPSIFEELPKHIQDLVFECNVEHRYIMNIVLNQLLSYIHCVNCNKLIDPSLLNKINCCSSVCMYQLQDNQYLNRYYSCLNRVK